MMRPGPRNLITDVPGLRVGNAADARLKSGVTVLDRRRARSSPPSTSAAARRAPARPTCSPPGRLVAGGRRASCSSGGSAFGLDAASGVADRLRALGRGYRAGRRRACRSCPAAILFDLPTAATRAGTANPYRALGAAALDAAAGGLRARHRRRRDRAR